MELEKDFLSTDKEVRALVDWVNPPTITDLKQDLDEAKPSHSEHVNKVNSWLTTLRGELNPGVKINSGRSKVQPKLVRKQNEWRYSALEEPFLSTEDMFKVNPVTHLDVEPARQNQLILNKQFRVDISRVKFINKYIRTAVNTGSVIVKLAWEEETGLVNEEQMVPIFPQSPEEAMEFLGMMIQQGQIAEEQAYQIMESGQWQQIPIGEEPVTVRVEKKYINRPVLEVKDSRSVVIDPSCEGDINKARFVVDKFLTDLSTLQKDGRYSNLERIQEKEFDARTDLDYNSENNEQVNFKFADKPRQKLVAFEYWGYWDINDDGIVQPIVATWIGDVMIRLEENPYPDKKLPFVIVQYLPPDADVVYGDADAALLKDNQDIVGAVTRAVVDLVARTANAQQGVRKDALDVINMKKFKDNLDFEFNPVTDIANTFFTTKMPEIPRSALETISMMNNEAEALTGVKSFSNGITSQALGDSVGGIRSALDATAKRELGILRRLANGIKEIGIKIISMNSVWLSDEEVIRITDDEFVAIKRDDLAGNFDLVVEVSTAEMENQKIERLTFLLQTLGQSLPFELTKKIMVKIAQLMKEPEFAMDIKMYEPQPDPMQVAMQEAQINLINAQAGKEASAAPKNKADEILKYAKAEQAGAAGRKTNSEADAIDLDYVEQASGLKQDRELEQITRKELAKIPAQEANRANKLKK